MKNKAIFYKTADFHDASYMYIDTYAGDSGIMHSYNIHQSHSLKKIMRVVFVLVAVALLLGPITQVFAARDDRNTDDSRSERVASSTNLDSKKGSDRNTSDKTNDQSNFSNWFGQTFFTSNDSKDDRDLRNRNRNSTTSVTTTSRATTTATSTKASTTASVYQKIASSTSAANIVKGGNNLGIFGGIGFRSPKSAVGVLDIFNPTNHYEGGLPPAATASVTLGAAGFGLLGALMAAGKFALFG